MLFRFSIFFASILFFCLGAAAEIGHGRDYDCHGNEGYGQLGDIAVEQDAFGNIQEHAAQQSSCAGINEKLGLDGNQKIKCQIISANGKPANADWDAYYTDNWSKHSQDKRDCRTPGNFCGDTTNQSGLAGLNGQFPGHAGFAWACKECVKEFLAKVKTIDCVLDVKNKDKKNHLELENGHLIIMAAPGFDGNVMTLRRDVDRIFPTVPKYFERMGANWWLGEY